MDTTIKVTEVIPHDSHKSYYGKAYAVKHNDLGVTYLRSYETYVASIDSNGFHKLWNGYSATTMRHVNSFRVMHGLPVIGKAEWDKLPTE